MPPLPVVKTINGKPVANLRAAAELIASCQEELLIIEMDDNRHTTIVLDRNEIEQEHDQIMEDNGVVYSSSPDLRDVWTK